MIRFLAPPVTCRVLGQDTELQFTPSESAQLHSSFEYQLGRETLYKCRSLTIYWEKNYKLMTLRSNYSKLSGIKRVWVCQHENFISAVKCGVWTIMIWACFAASGPCMPSSTWTACKTHQMFYIAELKQFYEARVFPEHCEGLIPSYKRSLCFTNFHNHCICLTVWKIWNIMKDCECLCFIILVLLCLFVVFVDICDYGEDQITFHGTLCNLCRKPGYWK